MKNGRHRKRETGAAGFTLAEALVALSLLSIITGMCYSFYLFAHKQVAIRESRVFEFDNAASLLESIATNVRESRATIFIDPTQWIFLTRNGDTASYRFADGKLQFNNVALTVGGKPLAGFSFDCFGNDSLLDANNDGKVDVRELDLNSDGVIDGRETANIAWIRAALTLHASADDTLSMIEAVKNNCEYDEGEYQKYF
jgi:type II secretory pathway pseudopilin PulG